MRGHAAATVLLQLALQLALLAAGATANPASGESTCTDDDLERARPKVVRPTLNGFAMCPSTSKARTPQHAAPGARVKIVLRRLAACVFECALASSLNTPDVAARRRGALTEHARPSWHAVCRARMHEALQPVLLLAGGRKGRPGLVSSVRCVAILPPPAMWGCVSGSPPAPAPAAID